MHCTLLVQGQTTTTASSVATYSEAPIFRFINVEIAHSVKSWCCCQFEKLTSRQAAASNYRHWWHWLSTSCIVLIDTRTRLCVVSSKQCENVLTIFARRTRSIRLLQTIRSLKVQVCISADCVFVSLHRAFFSHEFFGLWPWNLNRSLVLYLKIDVE